MSPTDAATDDNGVAFRNHVDDLHFPVREGSKDVFQIGGQCCAAADDDVDPSVGPPGTQMMAHIGRE
jgi:hypothetical protein